MRAPIKLDRLGSVPGAHHQHRAAALRAAPEACQEVLRLWTQSAGFPWRVVRTHRRRDLFPQLLGDNAQVRTLGPDAVFRCRLQADLRSAAVGLRGFTPDELADVREPRSTDEEF